MKKNLNTTLIYVLSLFGLLCCCLGGLGVFFAGPAYFMAASKIKDAELNPDAYEGNLQAMKTAKMVALIITIICAVILIYNIYDLATGGWETRQVIIEDFLKGYQEGIQGK